MEQFKLKECPCPNCGYEGNAGMGEAGKPPRPGDLAMCTNCQALNKITDDLGLTALTAKELKEIPKEVQDFLKSANAAIKASLPLHQNMAKKVTLPAGDTSTFIKDISKYAQERAGKVLLDVTERLHELIGSGEAFGAALAFIFANVAAETVHAMVATGGNVSKLSDKAKDDAYLFCSLYVNGIHRAKTHVHNNDPKDTWVAPEVWAASAFKKITGREYSLT